MEMNSLPSEQLLRFQRRLTLCIAPSQLLRLYDKVSWILNKNTMHILLAKWTSQSKVPRAGDLVQWCMHLPGKARFPWRIRKLTNIFKNALVESSILSRCKKICSVWTLDGTKTHSVTHAGKEKTTSLTTTGQKASLPWLGCGYGTGGWGSFHSEGNPPPF